MRILLIDDDQDILDLGIELFKMSGIDCKAVSTAMSAQELIAQESFDAIVSDIVMPEVSGIQLLKSLKENGRLVRPFVFVTGYASENPEAEALIASGDADKIFVKPLQFYEVAEYLKSKVPS